MTEEVFREGNEKKVQRIKNSMITPVLCSSLFFLVMTCVHSFATSTESMLEEARNKSYAQDYPGAIKIYNQVLAGEPDNVEALNGKARVLGWMGQNVSAKELYQKVLSRYPDNIDSLTGLADIHARLKNYAASLELLEKAMQKSPGEKEIFLRLARYNLWAQRKKEAIYYANAILDSNPQDKDAIHIKRQAQALHSFEHYTGYYFLNISNNVDGHNVYTGLRYRPKKNYSLFVQFDYLDRFREVDSKVLWGGSLRIQKNLTVSTELGIAPGAEIFPRFSGRLEIATPLTSALVLYGGFGIFHYSNTDSYRAEVAGEYYPVGNISLLARYSISSTEFSEGGNASDQSQFLKATWFMSDRNKIYIYFAHGSEAFRTGTIDQVGGIDANIFGIGLSYFITQTTGVSPSFEFQDRERGTTYRQFGLEIEYRF